MIKSSLIEEARTGVPQGGDQRGPMIGGDSTNAQSQGLELKRGRFEFEE